MGCCWPPLEHGSEVWKANKSQAAVMLGGAKCILGVLWALIHNKGIGIAAMPGTQRNFLIRTGPSSHVGVGRGSVGAGLLMISSTLGLDKA